MAVVFSITGIKKKRFEMGEISVSSKYTFYLLFKHVIIHQNSFQYLEQN